MKKKEQLFKDLGNLRSEFINETNVILENTRASKQKKGRGFKAIAIAASVLLLVVILPNTTSVMASTLSELPILGPMFKVVTIRQIESTNEQSTIMAEIPEIIDETSKDTFDTKDKVAENTISENSSIEEVNLSVTEYTDQLIEVFKQEHDGDTSHLDISYETITDTDTWFTLLITSTEIQASGYESRRYYNIDKTKNAYITLTDFIPNFEDKKEKINAYIIQTMKEKMAEDENLTYFTQEKDHTGFESIADDQPFYLNHEGNLVLSFDEYDVAPGYMGVVEFMIPKEVYLN